MDLCGSVAIRHAASSGWPEAFVSLRAYTH